MKITLYLFFIFFSTSAQSQETKRTIVDYASKKAVPFATVKVLHTNKGKIASVNGEFILSIDNNDSILISSVGYHAAMLTGKQITDTIFLKSKPQTLKEVIVKATKVVNTFVIGNGADLINKNIKCKYVPGTDNKCLPWSYGAGAEFAEPMFLPDSQKIYRLSKVYIPMGRIACWQPIFLQIYEPDSTGKPSEITFRKHLLLDSHIYKKGKIILDLKDENIFLGNTKLFFLSISWDTEPSQNMCLTTLTLIKSPKGICYSRNLQSSNYNWFLFDGNKMQQKTAEGRFRTMFAAEIEVLKH